MRLLRSFPAVIPPHRAYVVDDMPRQVMTDYDHRWLFDVDDDVLLIEWDIAVGQVELGDFIERVTADPERCRVAPYRIHESLSGITYKDHPFWAHRRYENRNQRTRFITPDDKTTHLFGFGMAYLPRALVRAYQSWRPDKPFGDCEFSAWHYMNAPDPEVVVDWDMHVVHLHYKLSTVKGLEA